MAQSIVDDIDVDMTGRAVIKVFGVGGAGGNAVQEMINAGLEGVQFICANTDMQALSKNTAQIKVQLGEKITQGLGAGADPNVGKEAAMESINAIKDSIGEAQMVFVAAGLGGGTGTGAAPVVAEVAKEMGALTVAVVSKPFSLEGAKRQRIAEEGLEELKKHVDSLIVIPNDRLISIAPKKTPIHEMMKVANEVLYNGVRGITDIINREGYINVDFADVRTAMKEAGLALMGTGRTSGENRAREATQQAISSPLLENVSLENARAILYTVTGTHDLTIDEFSEIGYMINEAVGNDANIQIISGLVFDDDMGDDIQVTIIATGIESNQPVEIVDPPKPSVSTVTDFRKNQKKFTDNRRQVQPVQPQIRANEQQELEVHQPQFQNMQYQNQQYQGQPYQNVRPAGSEYLYGERLPRNTYSRRRDYGQRIPHNPGGDSFTFDEESMEIPAFLRTQAD